MKAFTVQDGIINYGIVQGDSLTNIHMSRFLLTGGWCSGEPNLPKEIEAYDFSTFEFYLTTITFEPDESSDELEDTFVKNFGEIVYDIPMQKHTYISLLIEDIEELTDGFNYPYILSGNSEGRPSYVIAGNYMAFYSPRIMIHQPHKWDAFKALKHKAITEVEYSGLDQVDVVVDLITGFHTDGFINYVAISPEGTYIRSASGSSDEMKEFIDGEYTYGYHIFHTLNTYKPNGLFAGGCVTDRSSVNPNAPVVPSIPRAIKCTEDKCYRYGQHKDRGGLCDYHYNKVLSPKPLIIQEFGDVCYSRVQ